MPYRGGKRTYNCQCNWGILTPDQPPMTNQPEESGYSHRVVLFVEYEKGESTDIQASNIGGCIILIETHNILFRTFAPLQQNQ